MAYISEFRDKVVPVWKSNGLFFLCLFSLYIGQGISYGPLCLFHFVIPIYVLRELLKGIAWHDLITKESAPIHLFYILIFGISLFHPLQLKYLYFYGISYGIFCILWLKRSFIVDNYKSVVLFMGILVSIDLIIAALEFLTPFRYPISKISEYNHLFGRNFNMFASQSYCFDINYVQSSPTGLHWNQNNLALVFLMVFPFTLLVKNTLVKNVLRMIMIVLIVATGSRLGFYAVALILLFLMVFELKKREWSLLLPVLTIAFILTDGFYYFPTGMKKVKEVALISQSVFTDRFPEHCYLKKNSQESRNALFLTGKQLFLNKPIAGHGAGGFTHELEQMNRELDNQSDSMVTNAHNFILELLVDFGVLIVFPIALLFYRITQKLRRKKTSDLLLVFLLGIAMLAGTIMVSSLVYFLPFYLFLFLSYSVLSTDNGSLSLE